MTPDGELLRLYVQAKREEAFAELVRRHLNLVYSAALRQVGGDAAMAQDVSQAVFTDLARKASSLMRRPVLTGWLYTSVHFAAAKAMRFERRRRTHEQEAYTMRELLQSSAPDPDWTRLRPVLDAAMLELSESDREVLLLRYFENCRFADMGSKLGLNENAARMRVERALEKLRAALGRHGVASAATLASIISANAVQTAPVGLAPTLTAISLAGAASNAGTTVGLLKILTMTKLQTGIIGAIVVAGIATPLAVRHQAQVRLQERERRLEQQADRLVKLEAENARLSKLVAQAKTISAPRLPAPLLNASIPPAESILTNRIAEILKGKPAPRLTAEQIAPYLEQNHRNAASLLAAFRTSGDATLLEEAMRRFPDDPHVAFEAIFKKDSTPDEQRQWLNAFKQSAPANAFADYLSAANYFKDGKIDLAVQDFVAATGKSQFQDYTLERVQDDEEAFRAAGYSVAESKSIPASQLLLPQLSQLKTLSQGMAELSKSYLQAGDATSSQAVLNMTAMLGQRYSVLSPGEPEVNQLVGIAVERIALNLMDPSSPFGSSGLTVQGRLDQLAQQAALVKQLAQQTEALQAMMTDQDWISYKDRWRNFGEQAAGQWLIDKYGKK